MTVAVNKVTEAERQSLHSADVSAGSYSRSAHLELIFKSYCVYITYMTYIIYMYLKIYYLFKLYMLI